MLSAVESVNREGQDWAEAIRDILRINPTILSTSNKEHYRNLAIYATDEGVMMMMLEQAAGYYSSADYEKASLSYDTAWLMYPNRPETLLNAAASYENAGDTESALHRYQSVYWLYP